MQGQRFFPIPIACFPRLLLMGAALRAEYGSLERGAIGSETRMALVEHNRSMGPDEGGLCSARSTTTTPAANMENDAPMSETDSQAAAASIVSGLNLNVAFGAPVEEQPIWVGLYESIRDVFFPPHLPPLELTSTPIPVPDRMAVKPNPWAFGIATTLNLTILAVLLFVGVSTIVKVVAAPKPLDVTKVDVTEFKAPRKDVAAGGGGGSPDKMEAIKGRIPPRMQPLEITPKIEAPIPSIDVQKDIVIPDNPTLPNFGQPNSQI